MAKPAADYHRGEMDIAEQKATFHGFIGMSKWGSLAICTGILFFALVFCTKASLLQAGGAAVVVAALGILALREKKSAGH
jgi:hypothetical protein